MKMPLHSLPTLYMNLTANRGQLGTFRDVADGVGSAQPGFYGDCCAPAYRAAGAATFYRVLSP